MKKIFSAVLALSLVFSLAVSAQAHLLGDVDKDGSVNSSDALKVLSYAVGLTKTIDEGRADVNIDGTINSADALIILQIAVGSYEGELEVDDDLITTFKKDNVDPILKSGKYTLATTIVSNGTSVPSTIMVNGNDMSVDMTVDMKLLKTTCRLLVLDGKCYLAIPSLKVYGESNVTPPSSISGTEKAEYVKSEYFENGGKTYIIETYKATDGSIMQYYFLDGVWKLTVKVAADGTSTTQRIDKFEAGVNEANFSLKGYKKVNLDNYLK